jgi:sortase A
VLLIIGAGVGIAYPLWWQHRQTVAGSRVIHVLSNTTLSGCSKSSPYGPGILRIPAVEVVAPVVEGTSDQVLAVAVGHEASSPWPGETGMAMLEAHDVGYFASNQMLRPGDVVTYTRACQTYVYRVVARRILRPGDTIASPGRAGLVLDSCWPTDALWFTPSRLIITAVLVDVKRSHYAPVIQKAVQPIAKLSTLIPTPPDLFDEGWLAGTLTITGSPTLAWKDGPAPLLWESMGLQAFSALRSGEQGRASWISTLAPGVVVQPIIGAPYAKGTPVNVSEAVEGTVLQSVTVTTRIQNSLVAVTSTPSARTLRVTAVQS